MKFELEHKPLTTFSFSSLTDIVLLLLIFFLLTSQFVINSGVSVNLPKTKNTTNVKSSNLIVIVDSEGNIFYRSEKINFDKLSEIFASFSEKENNNLIIRADSKTELEKIVHIIDIARGYGILKFTVQTQKID